MKEEGEYKKWTDSFIAIAVQCHSGEICPHLCHEVLMQHEVSHLSQTFQLFTCYALFHGTEQPDLVEDIPSLPLAGGWN